MIQPESMAATGADGNAQIRGDLLVGIAAIADWMALDESKTYNLHRQELIPTFMKARTTCGRMSEIVRGWRSNRG